MSYDRFVLVSERLSYKPLSSLYCNDRYVSWLNDPEVFKYLEVGGNYDLKQLSQYLGEVEGKPDMLFWAIHLKSNDKHIGNIKIDPVNKKHGLGEYGIMMGDSQEWGKGYAKEASITVLKYCFDIVKIRKITLGVVKDNTVALRLYTSLGFEVEGVYKQHGFYNNKLSDVIRMALFNDKL